MLPCRCLQPDFYETLHEGGPLDQRAEKYPKIGYLDNSCHGNQKPFHGPYNTKTAIDRGVYWVGREHYYEQ